MSRKVYFLRHGARSETRSGCRKVSVVSFTGFPACTGHGKTRRRYGGRERKKYPRFLYSGRKWCVPPLRIAAERLFSIPTKAKRQLHVQLIEIKLTDHFEFLM